VPRKSDSFQTDLYPDTAAAEASHTGAEWLGGSSKMPKVFSLNPASDHKVHEAAGKSKSKTNFKIEGSISLYFSSIILYNTP